MKKKHFIYTLTFMSMILFSCNDKPEDFRDKFLGTYTYSIERNMHFTEFDPPIDILTQETGTAEVEKFDVAWLLFAFGKNGLPTAVDNDGNIGVSNISRQSKEKDPKTGAEISIDLMITYASPAGTINGASFSFEGSYSGTATMEINGEEHYSEITGSIVYRGNK